MKKAICVIMLTALAVIQAAAECSQADKKALEALDRSWAAAGQNGDRNALMALYADDFVSLPDMAGKAATIEATMKDYEDSKGQPAPANPPRYDHYIIACTPMTATITHRNSFWAGDGKGPTQYSRSVHFVEKRGGKWQVVSTTGHPLNDQAALWYLEQDWNDAIKNRDKAWFEKNYASDFSSISSSSAKLFGRAEDIADIVNDKSTMELVETTDMNIRMEGNAAIVTGVFRTKGRDEKGAAFDRRVRYTDVWIKRDGRWQVWSSQGTTIPVEVAKN